MPTIRPFEFTGLPRWTKEQVAVQESMAQFLSYRPFKRKFGRKLGSELETYLKAPCKFSRPEYSVVASGELRRVVPEVTCLLVIGASPGDSKILVDFDSGMAAYIIDRLLGGSGEVGRIQRPLTEIEQGVLSFVILKVLEHFHNGWQNGHELALTLDRFASRLKDVQDLTDVEGQYSMIGFKVASGKRIGYARVLVPASLVTTSFASPPSQGPSTPEELDYMRRILPRLGPRKLEARVEIATLDVSDDDIANIEAGDIIILENHHVSLGPNGIEGQANVKIGRGKNGLIHATLVYEGELSKIQVVSIVTQEQPTEEPQPMADGEEGEPSVEELAAQLDDGPSEPDDNLAEAEGLLRDVDAPVVVELGRIKLNAQQVVKLRPGQILRLPRGAKDPVNLVVNGKLFARGELIEVDGELGVRLVQVVGN